MRPPTLVLPSAHVRSLGRATLRDELGQLAPFQVVVGCEWPSDAHAVAYVAEWRAKPCRFRLASRHATEPRSRTALTIAMQLAIFDLDGPDHVASPAWHAEQLAIIRAQLPNALAYTTRGGMRLVFALSQPFPIASADDAARWRRCYSGACSWLETLGLHADRSCADWTRLFRLPFVRRDGEQTQSEIVGDPRALGAIDLDAMAGLAPEAEARPATDEGQEIGYPQSCHSTGSPQPGDGECRLLDLCNDAGLLRSQLDDRCWQVRCPNAARHTTGNGGAVLYANDAIGLLHCPHAHCDGMTLDAWLSLLGAPARESVRVIVHRLFNNWGPDGSLRIVLREDPEHAAECFCDGVCSCLPLREWSVRVRVPDDDSDERTWARWEAMLDALQAPDGVTLRELCRNVQGRELCVELDGARVARFLVP